MPGNLKERKKSLSSSSLSSSGSSSDSLSSDAAEKERDLDRSRHVKWKNGKGSRKVSSAKARPNAKDDTLHVRQLQGRSVMDRYSLSPGRKGMSSLSASTISLAESEVDYLKDALRGSYSLDELRIPAHDLKILERMALRVQEEKEREKKAEQKHKEWLEEERELRIFQNAALERYRKQVAARWRQDADDIKKKKAQIESEYERKTQSIQRHLEEKEQHALSLLEEYHSRRRNELLQQRMMYLHRKLRLEAELSRRQEEELKRKREIIAESQKRIEKAEQMRIQMAEAHKQRLLELNREAMAGMLLRRCEVTTRAKEALETMRIQLLEREKTANENYAEMVRKRKAQLEQQSHELERRKEQVNRVRRELDKGFDAWREQVRRIQDTSLRRAKEVVDREKERRSRDTREAEEKRELEHRKNLKRLENEWILMEKQRREMLACKDRRSRTIREEKERQVHQARKVAHTTAKIRDTLRRSLSPDTFDKKARRVAVELRITRRPAGSARPQYAKSHILLG
ncbi:unnamed protein product [Darwinula stevensoni]|uniref:Uncharacterized protein n=1 Tax=Darwinula stevensoni TaxID=69355 RepID=A0A7R8X5X5_9CRUS|nr:unnamed protein product [Darwinula stevensoni]CAG0880874.1 unnamed protein product [Darwinula stevensoni]